MEQLKKQKNFTKKTGGPITAHLPTETNLKKQPKQGTQGNTYRSMSKLGTKNP